MEFRNAGRLTRKNFRNNWSDFGKTRDKSGRISWRNSKMNAYVLRKMAWKHTEGIFWKKKERYKRNTNNSTEIPERNLKKILEKILVAVYLEDVELPDSSASTWNLHHLIGIVSLLEISGRSRRPSLVHLVRLSWRKNYLFCSTYYKHVVKASVKKMNPDHVTFFAFHWTNSFPRQPYRRRGILGLLYLATDVALHSFLSSMNSTWPVI